MNAEEREKQSLVLVRKFALASVGVGIFAGPLLDFVALTALLVLMIEKLAARYQRPFYPSLAKSLVASLLASAFQLWAAYGVAASLLKFVPVAGWGAFLLVSPAVAYAVTYAIGTLFIMHFESGGTLLDFDVQKMHEEFGRRYHASMRHAPGTADAAATAPVDAPPKTETDSVQEAKPGAKKSQKPGKPDTGSRAKGSKTKGAAAAKPKLTEVKPSPEPEPEPEPAPAPTAAPVVAATEPGREIGVTEVSASVSKPVAAAAKSQSSAASKPTKTEKTPANGDASPVTAVDEALKELVVKSYQSHSYQALCDAPTDAIRGVSDGDAQLLRDVFAVSTVAAFARFTWTEAAEAVLAGADSAGDDALEPALAARLLNSDYAGTPGGEVASLPVTALKGLGEKRAQALDESFRAKTIEKLARLKFVTMARTIVARAEV